MKPAVSGTSNAEDPSLKLPAVSVALASTYRSVDKTVIFSGSQRIDLSNQRIQLRTSTNTGVDLILPSARITGPITYEGEIVIRQLIFAG